MNSTPNKMPLNNKKPIPKKPLYELIEITSDLHKKTKMVASLDVVQKQFENDGEKALAELSEKFDEWMVTNLAPLLSINEELKTEEYNAERLRKVYDASHEIKGIALTLGYPLAGSIAYSLCNIIEVLENTKQIPLSVIDQHTTSIQAIVNNKIKNEGTAIARTLVDRLTSVTLDYIKTIENKKIKK